MSGQLPDLVLTLFAIVAGFGALLAAIVALPKALRIIGHTIRAIFRWFVAAVKAVAVVSDLPNRLDKIDQDGEEKKRLIVETKTELAKHIEATRVGTKEWGEMRNGLIMLLEKQDAVLHEVKNNGGSSMKDTTDRIEAGVKGLYARPGESGTAGREHEPA